MTTLDKGASDAGISAFDTCSAKADPASRFQGSHVAGPIRAVWPGGQIGVGNREFTVRSPPQPLWPASVNPVAPILGWRNQLSAAAS
jgi:hypothetical protein